VDFLRAEGCHAAVVLEINPRPTTSVVGLCRLLPPGRLARAWLSSCDASGFGPAAPGGLAASLRCGASASFDVCGRVSINVQS
jgi:hypothetical protein